MASIAAQAQCTGGQVDATFGVGGYAPAGPLMTVLATAQNSGGPEGLNVTSTGQLLVPTAGAADADGTSVNVVNALTKNGAWDVSWGGTGTVAPVGHGVISSNVTSVLDSAGNLLYVSTSNGVDVKVNRITPGSLIDTTYGTGGVATVPLTSVFPILGATTQPDGSLLIVTSATFTDSRQHAVIAKLTATGLLDTSFGTGGFLYLTPPLTTGAPSTQSRGTDLIYQTDGKILVLARARIPGSVNWQTILTRLNTNGSIDTSFGTAGFSALAPFGPDVNHFGRKMMVQTNNGRIVIAGSGFNVVNGGSGMFVMRASTTGKIDTTYGNGGANYVASENGTSGFHMTLQNNNKAVVSGIWYTTADQTTTQGLLARFGIDGQLDTTFGTGGLVKFTPTGTTDAAGSKVLYVGTKIAVVTNAGNGTAYRNYVAQFQSGTGACH